MEKGDKTVERMMKNRGDQIHKNDLDKTQPNCVTVRHVEEVIDILFSS